MIDWLNDIVVIISILTGINILIYLLNQKRNEDWVKLVLIVLPAYLVLKEIGKGGFEDIFFLPPLHACSKCDGDDCVTVIVRIQIYS